MQLFKVDGEIPFAKYLFLGDLVDRGFYGVELVWIVYSQYFKLRACGAYTSYS